MPEPSIGESFRQLGRDISGAMTAPIEARLRALSIRRGLAKEEEQAAALRKATEVLGEEAGTLLRAGVPPASIPALLKMNQVKKYAYLDKIAFKPTKRIDEDNTRKMMRSLESVVAKTDDPTELDGAMDSANANFNALKKAADFMADNENIFEESYFGKTAFEAQSNFKTGDEEKDSESLSVVENKMMTISDGKFKGAITGWLDDPEKTYGVDFSGAGGREGKIPSIEKLGTFMTIAIGKGALNREDAIEVLNTESTEDLYKIANSKDEPEAKRIFAGATARAHLAYEIATAASGEISDFTMGNRRWKQNKKTGAVEDITPEPIKREMEEEAVSKKMEKQSDLLQRITQIEKLDAELATGRVTSLDMLAQFLDKTPTTPIEYAQARQTLAAERELRLKQLDRTGYLEDQLQKTIELVNAGKTPAVSPFNRGLLGKGTAEAILEAVNGDKGKAETVAKSLGFKF